MNERTSLLSPDADAAPRDRIAPTGRTLGAGWAGIRGHLLSTAAAEAVGIATSLVYGVLLTRALQPSGRGLLAVAMNAVGLACIVGGFGVGKSLINVLGRQGNRFPKADIWGGIAACVPVMLAAGAAVAVLLLPKRDGLASPEVGALVAATACVFLLNHVLEVVLRMHGRVHRLNLARVLQSVGRLALLAAWVLLGTVTVHVALLIELLGCGLLIACAAGLVRPVAVRPSFSGVRPVVKAILAYGIAYQAYSLLLNLQYKADVFLLLPLVGPAETGQYATAARLSEFFWKIPIIINFVLLPRLAVDSAADASAKSAVATRLGGMLLVASAAVVALFPEKIVTTLYGESFAPAGWPLLLLLPGMVAAGYLQLCGGTLVAGGDLRPLIWLSGVGLVANLGLNLLLIPQSGAAGAAVASSISYGLTFLLVASYRVRTGLVRFGDLLVPTRKDLSLLLGRGGK